jgi:hypothetical protein
VTGDTHLEAQLAKAGQFLADVAGDAEFVSDSNDWTDRVRTVRDAYVAVQRTDPRDLESAVGLAVLSGAELRFHMVNHVDKYWTEDNWEPVVEVPDDDGVGRALVDEALSSAGHVLSLDPTNNLAAYLEGLAHECVARTTRRWSATCGRWNSIPGTRTRLPARRHSPDAAFVTGQVLWVDGGAEVTLRGEAPFATGVRYGPLRMARMVVWTIIGRIRSRRAA